MTFVSAQGTPIARRFGLWALDPSQDGMTLRAGDDATAGQGAAAAPVHRGESLVGRAWSGCAPLVQEASADAGGAVAIPIFRGARVVAPVAWHF